MEEIFIALLSDRGGGEDTTFKDQVAEDRLPRGQEQKGSRTRLKICANINVNIVILIS